MLKYKAWDVWGLWALKIGAPSEWILEATFYGVPDESPKCRAQQYIRDQKYGKNEAKVKPHKA